MGKKKYNPNKEIAKITGSMIGVGLGTNIAYKTMDSIPGGHSVNIGSTTKLMGAIPLVQTGGSLMGAMSMLGNVGNTKKKKR